MAQPAPKETFGARFVGLDVTVPCLDGQSRRYVNLDNAASTPPLAAVQRAVEHFLPYYSSVHRGTGFKSLLSTHAFEVARKKVLEFVGGAEDTHVCIFGKNTTEALNKLARRFPFDPDRDLVLSTAMEHHSNDLPWREVAQVIHVGLTDSGDLDEEAFDRALRQYGDRLALVAVTGASNVTGFLPPVHRLAEKAHAVGAHIVVDCAQLAPHRAIDVRPLEDPAHLDFVALSAHKLYAPFGTGALVGRRDVFERGRPEYSGGGTIEIVTLQDVVWAGPPERDEAGSPNTVGAVAMAAAVRELSEIGMQAVAAHEASLTAHTLTRLAEVPGVEVLGARSPDGAADRLGVVPFQLKGMSHFLVAAILGYEYGIGVRNGCFCAHPYILHLLGLASEETERVRREILAGDRSEMPGLVRISFGLYNTLEEVDGLIDALHRIARGEYTGTYVQDESTGEYHPVGWAPDYQRYFSI